MWTRGADRKTDASWVLTPYDPGWDKDTVFSNGQCLQWYRGNSNFSCVSMDGPWSETISVFRTLEKVARGAGS